MLTMGAKIDVAEAVLKLRNGSKRVAYDVADGLNDTIKQVQGGEFEQVDKVFTIREPAVFFGSGTKIGGAAGKITTFASAKRGIAYAEVQPVTKKGTGLGKGGAFLLPMFERGGPRPLAPGSETTAIPVTPYARPTKDSPIRKGYKLAALGLHLVEGKKAVVRHVSNSGKKRRVKFVSGTGEGDRRLNQRDEGRFIGKERSFLVRKSEALPWGGILQRIDKDTVRPLYLFEPPLPLDDRLHFESTGQRIASEFLDVNIRVRLEKSLAKEGLTSGTH